MLVTFHSKASASITYFGDIAIALLQMMGHGGTVPGALRAADMPAALARLRQGLAATASGQGGQTVQPDDGNTDAQQPVTLQQRALPLVQMLSAATRQECDVMWEKGAPPV
jgi:hypothetical protein